MTKPTGPACNLDCAYCYYREKEKMYAGCRDFAMKEETLEIFIQKYIQEQPGREVSFVWQGGEPTLLGLSYFRKVLQLQQKYGRGRLISNVLQTNGTLLNEDWCRFFKDNRFLIGISIDGPEELHDQYRINRGGKGTFRKVIRSIELLRKHSVEFNTLTVVNDVNVERPMEVYHFLKKIGSHYMQFIPVMERIAAGSAAGALSLVSPGYTGETELAPWSVPAAKFGMFLVAIFNEWVKKDVGMYYVQIFDAALANEVGVPAGVCVFNERCGNSLVMEHNGDLFSCDHFVYPEYRLGNIHHDKLHPLLQSPRQQQFGNDKFERLPRPCKSCDVYTYCRGECPKNRTLENGLNYFCEGYKLFFRHIRPYIKFMANELAHRRPPANIMRYATQTALFDDGL